MRSIINYITDKISSLLSTKSVPSIYYTLQQLSDVNGNILITNFLNEQLYWNEKYIKSKRITHFHKSVFTQNGEDGIIEEIFNRIGVTNRYFVEFGVHGVKNNSTLLLIKNWTGLWIGGSELSKQFISDKFKFLLDKRKLTFSHRWITRENIEEILKETSVPKEFDFLSIDLDGNDYWIWDAIKNYSPRAVCIEYNATFPASLAWVMTYNGKHSWDQSSYFGASLKSLELLGRQKGYELIGCDFAGCNAFFIRNDQNLDLFERPFTAEHHYEPPRYYLKRPSGHKQGFGPFEQMV
ncbi:MAG: hypothetical protein MUF28_08185 [Ignavibacterium sp.]|jgi:hypothetical protein|nr:hypothetical protein [Ignavibacterium sp.]